MKRVVAIAVTISMLLLSAFSVGASSNQLSYWEATMENKYEIGRFPSKTITYSYQKLNNNSSFYFNESVIHAKNEWTKGLGIKLTYSLLMQNADMKIYGGTVNDMYSMGLDISTISHTGTAGVAYHNRTYSYPLYEYNNTSVSNYKISSSVVMLKDSGSPRNDYLQVMTHEMGHALGWFWHSADPSLIMFWAYGSSGVNLTQRDIRHLKQVYDK